MRKKVGILFKYNENWIGGTYYILNLIHALKRLPEADKPHIVLISEKQTDVDYVKTETNYPYFEGLVFPVLQRGVKIPFFKKLYISRKVKTLDAVFPYPFKEDLFLTKAKRKLIWIGDFQEKYLPDFFSKNELELREAINQRISSQPGEVIFSSNNAWQDYDRFYPNNKNTKYILQFAVTHPELDNVNELAVLNKYDLNKPFYMSPNQFWAHKNHYLIIDAIQTLKANGENPLLIFTGKEYDYRNPEYTTKLKEAVHERGLDENIRFLGFIDRKEQLVLMKKAKCVIQASLFEGWSTVVEDCKALGCSLVLSDLPVHREQAPKRTHWFNPHSVNDLLEAMQKPSLPEVNNVYDASKLTYANQFKFILDTHA